MKRAIEALRGEQEDLRDAAAREEAVSRDPNPGILAGARERYVRSAALRREWAAELDAAIKLLEAASAVRELVRATLDPAMAPDTTASAQEQMDASERYRRAIEACERSPHVRALIDESAAGAKEEP